MEGGPCRTVWLGPTQECPPRGVDVRAAVKRRRIINGVKGVNRVVYDIVSPPVTARECDVGADRDPEGESLTNGISMNTPRTARIASTSDTTTAMFTAHISPRCDGTPKTGRA
jgi:GMP synthase C terminal domain